MTILFHLAGNTALTNESLMRMWEIDQFPSSLLTLIQSILGSMLMVKLALT